MFDFLCGKSSDRLKVFIENTKDKKYETKEELNKLFDESRNLVFEYLTYYDKKRLSKKKSSGRYRFFIWLFGLIGLSLPIIGASLVDIKDANLAEYGYGFIMLAAVIVAMKNFMGATNGHIRYVKTQLELEKIISTSTIVWQEKVNFLNEELTKDNASELYGVISKFLDDSYKEILSETDEWGNAIVNDEKNFLNTHLIPKKEDKTK